MIMWNDSMTKNPDAYKWCSKILPEGKHILQYSAHVVFRISQSIHFNNMLYRRVLG